jgi:putative oxidoreductase
MKQNPEVNVKICEACKMEIYKPLTKEQVMNKLRPCGITFLRIVVGVIFIMHGWQKLSMGFDHVAGFLGSIGIPLPRLAAVLLTLVELIGGVALILGIFTSYVAALLAIDMLVALIRVHAPNGFFAPKGVEFPLLLLAANINLIFHGPGSLSLSGLRKKTVTGP